MVQKTVNEISSIPILPDEEFLTEDEIEEYIDNYKPKLPSFVAILLKNNLRGKKVTKRQLDKIIERITEVLSKGKEDKTEELNKKLQVLEQKLDTIMKLTTVAASTKLSEELEKTEEGEESKEVPVKLELEEKSEEEKEKTEEEKVEKVEGEISGEKKSEVEEEGESEKGEVAEEGTSMKSIEEEKKYRLEDIPEDAVSITLAFKWLEFLISRVGTVNLPDILDYYNKIGWISNKVILKLLRFTKNMKIILDTDHIKPRDRLTPSDHITSLLYIEKLAGRPIDSEVLEMLEIEIRRIKKWAEELQCL